MSAKVVPAFLLEGDERGFGERMTPDELA